MSDLSKRISQRTKIPEKDVKSVLNTLNTIILQDICSTGTCRVPRLGTFIKKKRKSHNVRSVNTGKPTYTKPSATISFECSERMKDALKDE